MEVGPKGARIPVVGQNGPEGSAGGCAPSLGLSSSLAALLWSATAALMPAKGCKARHDLLAAAAPAAGLRARPNGSTLQSLVLPLPSHKQMLAPAAAAVGPSIDPNAAAAMTGGPNLSSAQTGPASGAGQPQLGSNAGSMASGPNHGNNGGTAAGQPGTNMGAGGAGMGSPDNSHRQMGGMDSQSGMGGMGNNTSGQGDTTGEPESPGPALNPSAPGAGVLAVSKCFPPRGSPPQLQCQL